MCGFAGILLWQFGNFEGRGGAGIVAQTEGVRYYAVFYQQLGATA
jgi:hypothetical protein